MALDKEIRTKQSSKSLGCVEFVTSGVWGHTRFKEKDSIYPLPVLDVDAF